MRATRRAAIAALGTLAVLCAPAAGRAQTTSAADLPIGRIASFGVGAIQGTVEDDHGKPLAGAMVSALGATTRFAVTDRGGRFELRTLTPGPYLVRAHLTGYVASRGQIVDVRSSTRASWSITLSPATADALPVLAAGFGPSDPAPAAPAAGSDDGSTDDHSEIAWRLRHARRSVLKDTTLLDGLLTDAPSPDASIFGTMNAFGHIVASPARAASALFGNSPITGQVNFLTTGSLDSSQPQTTLDGLGRGVAYVAVGAPVGDRADWAMRAALTQGDFTSWIVAGSYVSRATEPHHYEFGMSYATQRFGDGNPVALHAVTDANRDVGEVYGFDTWTLGHAVAFTYGGRYSRYDYLDGSGLLSPRASFTIAPASRTRVTATLSSRATAPGAEEFLPPSGDDVWLPPQRTFSSFAVNQPLAPERTNYSGVSVEHDFGRSTLSLGAFRQQVDNQIVTVFGVDGPGADASFGHYYVGNSGNVEVSGWTAGWRAAIADRFQGSVTYSMANAAWNPASDLAYLILLAPSSLRLESERLQDVTASLQAEVPETSTRLLVLYRISNGFATRDLQTPGLDYRFDVQVRQSLPFMNFSTAQWEMLVAVRNFYREAGVDESMYDELLVLHPPKRIIGGLTLRF